MRNLADALVSYVPARIVARLAAGGSSEPFAERLSAALLFADISDSTALAERLAAQGSAGAEEFSRLLNAYLGVLIDEVSAHGGDVVKFAGDGLFALWPADEDDGLATATRRAAQCALAVQQTLRVRGPKEVIRLAMRIGVGAGEVIGAVVGSPMDRMEYLIVGAPVMEACRAERIAQPFEVVLTADARRVLGDGCVGVPLPFGGMRLEAVTAPAPLPAVDVPPVDAHVLAALRAFAPPAIVARLSAGQNEWLAELRHVTILFSRLPDWAAVTFSEVQDLTSIVLKVIARYQGTLTRLGVDEHGPVSQFAFGLPPVAHEDDPARGVQAALEMQAALRARGVRSGIGIATGRAFCGAVGGARRREYATVGDAVNVAARLMYAAGDGILCDAATAAACGERLSFESLAPIEVKGKAEPLAIYRPRGRNDMHVTPRPDLIGRATERAQLRRRLHTLLSVGKGGVVLIEGEAGLGKSRLAMDLRAQASALGINALLGSCDAIEVATAYHAWRPVLTQLLELDALPDEPLTRRAHLLARWGAESAGDDAIPSVLQRAPLLNAVVPLDIPENELTAQMSGEARAHNLHELLVELLQCTAQRQPLLLVFEDAHWMDSASWAVTLLASKRVAQLLLVVVTRPPGEAAPPEYRRLVQAPGTEQLKLDALSPDETVALVCQGLGVTSLSAPVAALIQERAGGHPFFAEELAYALRDAGIVTTVGGECRLAVSGDVLQQLPLPRTLHGVITSRIDRLTPRQQLVLKLSSVIGRTFAVATLVDVHPLDADRAALLQDLQVLEQLDLVHVEPTITEPTYVFKHAITRDVAYDLMAFAQRRQLHRAVGEWYERSHHNHLSPYYPVVAHHFSRAVDLERPDPSLLARAIDAVERAGEQAVQRYANEEAVRFFEDAVRMQMYQADGSNRHVAQRRRAGWERRLGEAYYRLGRPLNARQHLEAALALLGQRIPSRPGAGVVALIGALTRQAAHRLLPDTWVARARGDQRNVCIETAGAYELLSFVQLLVTERVASLLANMRSLNSADLAAPSAELANACALFGLSGGILFGPRLAERYFTLGRKMAERVGDRNALGRVWMMQGFFLSGRAQWDAARHALEEAVAIFDGVGDLRWRESVMIHFGTTYYNERRYAEAQAVYEGNLQRNRQRGDIQSEAWCLSALAGTYLMRGDSERALQMQAAVEHALRGFEHLADHGTQLSMMGLQAVASLRLGDLHAAATACDAASQLIRSARPLLYFAQLGYTSVAEVALALWEHSLTDATGEPARWARASARAVADLWWFARYFPLGQPQAWLWSGMYHWLRGRQAKAQAEWRRAVVIGERLGMAQDVGLAHYQIGRHLDVDDAARTQHLRRACDKLRSADARYDLACAAAALEAVAVGPRALAAATPLSAERTP